eukprot:254930_1
MESRSDELFNVMKTYPIISGALTVAFPCYYFYRSYKAYRYQNQSKKRGSSSVSISVRLINVMLCITSITIFALTPIVFSMTVLKPLLIAAISILQLVYPNVIDVFTSPTSVAHHNYKSLCANGYSTTRQVIYGVMGTTLVHFAMYYFIKLLGLSLVEKDFRSANIITVIAKIAVNLAVSDFLYNRMHRSLHLNPKLAIIHRMHHCCFISGLSSAFVFNPIDLLIEFGPSIFPVIGLGYLLHSDKLATVLSLAIMTGWYYADHDENLGAFHAEKHHRYCLGYFHIYFDVGKENLKHDHVRKMVVKSYGHQKTK